MEDLENYGVQEIGTKTQESINGGFFGLLPLMFYAGVAVGYLVNKKY
ncbi:hypothetical protein [Allomuricauda sp. SCSIO 65647]|nr:hypothetical protein [Muricauda sp. SCSIO 65647]UJH67228.1 hypothetical protein L0P89_14910 [Muricauda sp. SCSIO 65647]